MKTIDLYQVDGDKVTPVASLQGSPTTETGEWRNRDTLVITRTYADTPGVTLRNEWRVVSEGPDGVIDWHIVVFDDEGVAGQQRLSRPIPPAYLASRPNGGAK